MFKKPLKIIQAIKKNLERHKKNIRLPPRFEPLTGAYKL